MNAALPLAIDGRTAAQVAEHAIRRCGAIVASAITDVTAGKAVATDRKGWNNLVTEIDRASEQAALDVLRPAFPDVSVLSEEAGEIGEASEYRWVIDPVDGTRNLAKCNLA